MSDPATFSRRIATIAAGVEKNAGKLVRRVALEIDQALVLSTPVDTGRARANWLVSLDSPRRDAVDASSAGDALASGASVIHGAKDGQKIYISNSLPYIGRLNAGSSAQAPAGFVEAAALHGVRIVKGARLLKGGSDV